MEDGFRILVPVDGSAHAEAGAAFASDLAVATGARIDLLYVSYFSMETDPEDEDSWLPESIAGPVGKTAKQALDAARRRIAASVPVELVERVGSPIEEILDFAKECGHRCIVLGTEKKSGAHKLLGGSVSRSVLEQAECSVTLVKH